MRSHPMELDVWFLVGPFVYFHTSCVRTAKALVRLRGYAGSREPSLVAYVISTIISWAGSFNRAFNCLPFFFWNHGKFDKLFLTRTLYRGLNKSPIEFCKLYWRQGFKNWLKFVIIIPRHTKSGRVLCYTSELWMSVRLFVCQRFVSVLYL